MAAGATYEPIATTTLSVATSSINFSSIPSTYTDLKLVVVCTTSAGNNVRLRLNGDTATNFSHGSLYGDGTTSGASSTTAGTFMQCFNGTTSTTVPTIFIADIFSYAGSTNKTVLFSMAGDLNGSGNKVISVGLWRSTAAVNTVNLVNAANYQAGTIATLYGIAAA